RRRRTSAPAVRPSREGNGAAIATRTGTLTLTLSPLRGARANSSVAPTAAFDPSARDLIDLPRVFVGIRQPSPLSRARRAARKVCLTPALSRKREREEEE